MTAHSYIPREEGEFLQKLILEVKPRVSVEVGLGYGISSLFICEALTQVQAERHIIIDPYQFPGWGGIGLHNLKEAGYDRLVDFREAPSHLALPQLEAEGLRIDFAFIDGWHTFDYALVDFFYIDRLLRVGGVVAFDDAMYTSIRKVCRYVATNRAYTVIDDGVARPRPRRPWWETRLLATPGVSTYLRRMARPEIIETDEALRLPNVNYTAFKKERDDILGDGSPGTRRWDFHAEF
ncbi:MAG: class I SAM-dependent methyltransferase [Candidatus Rokubacteria bacterium]|nr:class I SAM-dependent methyltransferase [Candidatus Rokubacteria bacterium]